MNRAPFRIALLLIPLVLACFALLPQARATCQQGCLTGNNTALGDDALSSNTTGYDNTATGFQALFRNTTGYDNTATGFSALTNNRTGYENTANGVDALSSNTTGYFNTATGSGALSSNTTGYENTATGLASLSQNTTGGQNTANGFFALFYNSTGYDNTATGFGTLFNNTTGYYNTANGVSALTFNNTGVQNTATGFNALSSNSTGNNNTATGSGALANNNGSNNIALGNTAGANLTAGDNNIDIGNAGVAGEAGVIRIGTTGTQTATFIAGIRGVPITGGTEVGVNSNGQLGQRASSARFKEAIQPMDKASEAIFSLQPVTFRYKKTLDPKALLQFGLVAEQVAKVDPNLVACDDQGKPFTVRCDEVNVMLLNEFLKEHRKVQDLEANAARQQKQIEALTAGLQKVSAQLELSNPSPQTVLNNQ